MDNPPSYDKTESNQISFKANESASCVNGLAFLQLAISSSNVNTSLPPSLTPGGDPIGNRDITVPSSQPVPDCKNLSSQPMAYPSNKPVSLPSGSPGPNGVQPYPVYPRVAPLTSEADSSPVNSQGYASGFPMQPYPSPQGKSSQQPQNREDPHRAQGPAASNAERGTLDAAMNGLGL